MLRLPGIKLRGLAADNFSERVQRAAFDGRSGALPPRENTD